MLQLREMKEKEKERMKAVLDEYVNVGRESLIPILQDLQNALGFLSKEAIIEVGTRYNIPVSKVYSVASFYNQFRFSPIGKYHIQICRGTACHVKGSLTVLEMLKRELKISAGETTPDGLFSFEIVACIGACGLAPVISINGEFFGNVTSESLKEILQSFRSKHVGKK